MNRDGRRRRRTLRTAALLLVLIGLVTVLASGCGGDTAVRSSTTAGYSPPSESAQPSGGGEGALLAKEILGTFDELVAEVARLAKDKPASAVLKPQLEQLYESYVPKMTELNEKYLALRDSSDVALFGECNSYLGSNRGMHVADKDNVLSEALRYYNFELGDQEMVSLLSDRPVELLEIAVDQG